MLSGGEQVKESTRQRVVEAAERVGYAPSAIARSFVLQQSGNIGVMLPVIPNVRMFSAYFFAEILSGIGNAVEQRGYSLLLQFRGADERPDYATAFRTHKVDGCIVLGAKSTPEDMEALHQLHVHDWPFCIVGQRFNQPYHQIDADHIDGTRQAVQHLLRHRCNRILMMNGPDVFSNSADRREGYLQTLQEAGLKYDPMLYLEGNYSRKSGYEAAEAVFSRRGQFDAIVAANDRMAIGLMQGLKEEGLRAGIDYAIVGYDGSDASRLTDPPLSTVRVPFFEMGVRAAQKLIDVINGQEPGRSTPEPLLKTELVVRESSFKEGSE